jgi:cell division protein ZapA (FtsZ GTPase activity inhibitor)
MTDVVYVHEGGRQKTGETKRKEKKGKKSEVKKAKEVADFLAKEVSRVESQQSGESSTASDLTTLMLAALNIAHQNLELEDNYSKFRQDIAERSAKLIRKIDEHVQ